MMWITVGVMIGVSGMLPGLAAVGTARACSCVEAIDLVGGVADVGSADAAGPSVGVRSAAVPDTTLPTDSPTSDKNSTAGLLVLIGVVAIVGTGALVLTLKYRKR